MPEAINTSPLQDRLDDSADAASEQTMVKVSNVSMIFNMASEQLNSLKEYAIALAKRELRFKEFRALDDVSFEVKKGDVFGILGTNGSGKSTMLKIVAGVLEPSEGTCSIHGNIAPLIELGAGFDLELTARENIYLNGALLGYSKKFIEQHFDEIVDFADIEKFLDMPMKNYSSGMVARIAFAIATVIIPDILIVDEVLSVGDFMFQQKCEERITRLIKEHGVTVLIVSHNNDQIERLCNRAIWIEKGRVRMIGDAHEVCEAYRLLGGRTGSQDSEKLVFNLLQESTKVPNDLIATVAGEDRYSSAVKLIEKAFVPPAETAIVVPGQSTSPSMIAACLSGLLDAPVFLTSPTALPDITAQAIKRYGPTSIILLGDEFLVSTVVERDLVEACGPRAHVQRIDAHDLSSLALGAYRHGRKSLQWSRTAALTFDGCIGELISIAPYLHMEKIPLFFYQKSGEVDEETIATLQSDGFSRLLALGGEADLPDEILPLLQEEGVEVVRLAGSNPYEANALVNRWIVEQAEATGLCLSRETMTVCSAKNPFDAFAGSAYAGKTRSLFLLEDPIDLDSVAHAISLLSDRESPVERLTFLGSDVRFTKGDKAILGKAILTRGL